MAINLNDNIRINAGKPIDTKYLSSGNTAYISNAAVNAAIPIPLRYTGLTVNIGGVEYWYKNGVGDVNLIEKKYDTQIPSDDFVTGGTNVGFFSGFTGTQTLPINHTLDNNYDGNYISLYNHYYRDVDGIIRVGVPSDGILKRGYVKITPTPIKSWIWNEYTGSNNLVGWILIDGNIEDQLGTFQNGITYYDGSATFPHTATTFIQGTVYINGSNITIDSVLGNLLTGDTLTIGGPVFRDKVDSTLQFRTIKSKTPNLIDVGYDDAFIHLSGVTGILDGENIGAGEEVFAQKTGTTLQFRTLQGSGNTEITQTGDNVVIYSSPVATGLEPKLSASVATTENITYPINGLLTIDGVTLTSDERVLVKDQTNATQNGIWVAKSGAWVRSPDFNFDPAGEIAQGALVPVISGDTNNSSIWVLVTPDPIISGGTDLIFTYFSGLADMSLTNLGGGEEIGIRVENSEIELRTLVGSGSTTVSSSGDTVIIYSDSSGLLFNEDILVSLDDGKTFGKYVDGDTIPANGKSAADVIKLATFEAIDPTPILSSSGNDVAFGETGKTVNLTFSYTINTPAATIASASVQYYSGSTWVELTDTTGTPSGYTHTIIEPEYTTGTLQYRYIVVDSAGATGTTTHSVPRETYAAPTMSLTLSGSTSGDETENSREKGNVDSNLSGSITSQRSLVDITAWTLERRYDGGSWTVLASGSSLSTQSVTISSTPDTGTIPTSATSINYRITYTDEYTSGDGGNESISFFYYSYYGFNSSTTLSSAQIQGLGTTVKLSSVNLIWNDINTPSGNYTYYAYPNTYGDITKIEANDVRDDTTAWQELSQVSVTNTYSESLNYRVWRTNATQAYIATDDIIIT